MAVSVSIQVPIDDRASLEELQRSLGDSSEITQLHPFDGETVVQSVFVVTGTAIPLLRVWLRAKVDERKSYRVIYDGTEYHGYTVDEVETLVRALSSDARDG